MVVMTTVVRFIWRFRGLHRVSQLQYRGSCHEQEDAGEPISKKDTDRLIVPSLVIKHGSFML